MANGTIKKLVGDRGFGFIQTEDGSDIFFHRSQVEGDAFDTLREGQSGDVRRDLLVADGLGHFGHRLLHRDVFGCGTHEPEANPWTQPPRDPGDHGVADLGPTTPARG